MNKTSLTYTGELILETKTRRTVARNHGSKYLFRLLSCALCKDSYGTELLPTYFMLYNSNQENILAEPVTEEHSQSGILNTYVAVVSQSVNEDNIYKSTFTALIDSTMLRKRDATEVTLCLVSGDQKYILAAVNFDINAYRVISAGGQSYVKWIMTISNDDAV